MSIRQAQQLAESGKIEEAWEIIKELMNHEPNNPHYLLAATFCMQKAGNWPVAYHLAKASAEGLKDRPEPYMNIAAACDQLYQVEEGIRASKTAYRLSDSDKLKGISLMNHASLLINNGRYEEAEPICKQAIDYNPTNKAYGNLGICQLAQGNWKGWSNYSKCLGTSERMRIEYNLPEWTGEGVPVIYGEQGLGDEISFASMLNDVKEAVIDCDYRLKGLFTRSFPQHHVHGGRWQEKYKGKADAQLAIGELGKFYRNTDADFPRKAYLAAEPLRASQWQHLKDSVKKPLIGIAWTGGMAHTASKYRKLDKTVLSEIMQGIDAHYVSLEYKEREAIEGINVYSHATLTDDYDDTAALVSKCDVVITVQTAVAHLAGALGVPCIVLVPETNQWRYNPDNFLWYTDKFHVHKAKWDINKVIEIAKNYL